MLHFHKIDQQWLFISTTGDVEQTGSFTETLSRLLFKSHPHTLFSHLQFALCALGDQAYGPNAFCAARRKLALRLMQLGAEEV
jgi:sulfite reductase alpha subunit-like flavoprotein